MLKILLTGGNGQVGWELQRSLSPLGELHVFDRQGLDLADTGQIRRRIREIGPNVIVNAAAYTAVDRAESERELAMAVNGVAPGVFAEEARDLNAALIHYSTDYVFDGSGDRAWREDDPPRPVNFYGESKLAGEEVIRATSVPHLIFRTSWVYGIHGHNFVKTILRIGAEREEMKIVDDQIGAPTSARVIAEVTAQILAQMGSETGHGFARAGGTYHLCCAGETSWCGFAAEIVNQAQRHEVPLMLERTVPVPTSAYPTAAPRPKNSRLDCTRLRTEFDLQLPRWEEALSQLFPLIAERVSARD